MEPEDILFKDCAAVNPGILRPNWYCTLCSTLVLP